MPFSHRFLSRHFDACGSQFLVLAWKVLQEQTFDILFVDGFRGVLLLVFGGPGIRFSGFCCPGKKLENR